ncbi:MAG: NUDIX hydrolase [Candidatus Nealsonbacteria bacterium]
MINLKNPKATCGAIIMKDNKVLLTKRNISPYKGYWCIPGGHIGWGENVETAVKREVREEVGLNIKPRFFKYYDEIIPEIKWHAVTLTFVDRSRGPIKIDKSEVKEFKWFTEKEVQKLKIAFKNKKTLKDYFKIKNVEKIHS